MDVSDHALVRYMERVRGDDLEPIRDEIRALVRAGRSVVSNKRLTAPMYVVQEVPGKEPMVVTVLEPGMRPQRRREFTLKTFITSEPEPPALETEEARP